MKQPKDEPNGGSDLHLGTLLGRRQAFSLIAGRCSAADAACLREIRNQKSYRSLKLGWKQFCCEQVGMSHTLQKPSAADSRGFWHNDLKAKLLGAFGQGRTCCSRYRAS